jgi:hypothetical protein
MKKHTQQPQVYRKPRPKRVSMGELHYFALTFRDLLRDGCPNKEIRQQTLEDIKAHCPTLFQAMETWFAEIGSSSVTSVSSLTFTYDVPLPQAFQDDLETYREVPQ